MADGLHNNEIDLIELRQSLWDGKWLVGGVSATALFIGGAQVALTPNSFDASIIVRPLDASAIERFRLLDNAISNARETDGPTTPSITSRGLLAEFTEILLQRQTIAEAAADNEAILRGRNTRGTSLEEVLREFAFEVDVKHVEIPAPSISGTSNTVTPWEITWQANDEDVRDAFISDSLRTTNATARERLLQRISGEAEQIQRAQERRASLERV